MGCAGFGGCAKIVEVSFYMGEYTQEGSLFMKPKRQKPVHERRTGRMRARQILVVCFIAMMVCTGLGGSAYATESSSGSTAGTESVGLVQKNDNLQFMSYGFAKKKMYNRPDINKFLCLFRNLAPHLIKFFQFSIQSIHIFGQGLKPCHVSSHFRQSHLSLNTFQLFFSLKNFFL